MLRGRRQRALSLEVARFDFPFRSTADSRKGTKADTAHNPSSNRMRAASISSGLERTGDGIRPVRRGVRACRAHDGAPSRNAGVPQSIDPVFQPSNGMTHRFQSPKIPTRFRWAPHSCSGLRGTSPREGRRWRRAATIKALAPNPTVVDCQRVEAMSCAEREPRHSASWSESRYAGPRINGQSATGRAYV